MEQIKAVETKEKTVRGEKLFNFRPVFFLALALCFGIWFSYACFVQGVSAWWLCILAPLAVTLFFLYFRKILLKRALIAALSLVLAFGCGFSFFFVQFHAYHRQITTENTMNVVGRVVEKSVFEQYASFTLDGVFLDETKVKGKLVAYLPASFYENVRLGDEIVLVGLVQNTGNDASVYEIQNDVRYYASAEELAVSGHTFRLFLFLRERIKKVVYAGMEKTSAGITLALLLGDSSGIESGLLANVRYGGIAHIFAVSGLHIGALFGACLLLFQKTKLKMLSKPTRFVSVAAIVLFYGGICGYTPSVLRAIIMCLTAYAATLVGIAYDSTETLGLAAILVLCISPVSLFAVGFQLSFAACLGIVWFASRMQRAIERGLGFERQKRERHPLSLWQRAVSACVSVVCVSLSATVATAPILLNAFGYLSGWSLLLNFIFTPMIAAIFSILLLFVAIACLLPTSFSPFVLYLPYVFWSIVLLIFQLCDFSAFAITNVTLPSVGVISYYAGLLFLTDKWNMSRKWTYLLSGLCFFGFLCTAVFSNL